MLIIMTMLDWDYLIRKRKTRWTVDRDMRDARDRSALENTNTIVVGIV